MNMKTNEEAIHVTRRKLLKAAGYGAALALLPGLVVSRAMAYPTSAADGRFVMIFLRGGMDGLFAFAPVSDPVLASMRPNISQKAIAQGISLVGTG